MQNSLTPRYHVVLVHPDMPGNVGNIGRTCLALGCRLHLVKPYGFRLTPESVRRSGLDYWKDVDLLEWESLDAWLEWVAEKTSPHPACSKAPFPSPGREGKGESRLIYLVSTKGRLALPEAELSQGAVLVFGAESAGLPDSLWQRFAESSLVIPQASGVRSMNVSSAVACVLGAALAKLPSNE
jgi:tRNA (cytidine/uridine-2'-O-)-methyltransferase